MRKITTLSASAVALALALVGCSGDGGTVTPGSDAPSDSSTSASSEQAAPAAEEKTSGAPTFGDTYTWDDGVAITISEPQPFTPSDTAYVEGEGEPVIVDVRATNNSDEPIESIGFNIQASSGESQAEAIFDSANGVDMPTATIQPGKSLKWKAAFAVADPSDITMDVSQPDLMTDKVHFASK